MVSKSNTHKMINKEILKDILYNAVKRTFIIVFPPIGEDSLSKIDMRIGLVTEENSNYLYVIGTNMDDLWSPILSIEPIPAFYFSYLEFEDRTKKWMSQELYDDILLDYYDFSSSSYFSAIVGQKINSIKLLSIENVSEPFGVELLFDNDFILSFSNSDGNTIETKVFNKNQNIKNFYHLGDIIYSNL